MTKVEENLGHLYKSWIGKPQVSITKLPGSGSYRSYYRIIGPTTTVIGAHNEDIRENNAFISFTNHFRREGLPVPEILATDPVNKVYLITDLGDTTLYQLLSEKRIPHLGALRNLSKEALQSGFPPELVEIYKKALSWLPVIQVKAGKSLDYNTCYPRAAFDRQSMMWDLNYFKYYFLKLAKVPFDEQGLEDDFERLCDILLQADAGFFMFRDFQSRNIMVFNNEPWFIDYQGGRKGALQYDVASLLSDGKADIPVNLRDELLNFYLDKLAEIFPVNRDTFMKTYHGFVLIRILQALGAYGFRGYYENKPHFLQSIPYALRNLFYLRSTGLIGFGLDTLMKVIDSMVAEPIFYDKPSIEIGKHIDLIDNKLNIVNSTTISIPLTVTIHSFSYKKSLPADGSGNGGGFVFDCRALPNPGRYDEFKLFDGRDQPVIDFLLREPAVGVFLNHVYSLVDQSVRAYIDRKFENLMVSFGCTGGRHRSVYCAEKLAEHLKTNYKINVKLIHSEQEST